MSTKVTTNSIEDERSDRDLLLEILEKVEELTESQARLDEAISNLNLGGRNYSIEEYD